MAPKGNSKAEAAKARKADAAAAKNAEKAKQDEAREAEKWSKGAKGKSSSDAKAEKAAEAAARKAEAKKLLEAEEASLPSKPVKAPGKKGGAPPKSKPPVKTESFSASGIDNALEMMTLVNEKTDKASVGQRAAKLDAHPERRFKAAFEAYKENELDRVKKEHPHLRLNQYHDILFKEFQKAPENPFNQVTVAYDAKKAERVEALETIKENKLAHLRE